MDDIKQGSIDIAGQTIDLEDIQDAYDEDLDKQRIRAETPQQAGPAVPGPTVGMPGLGI